MSLKLLSCLFVLIMAIIACEGDSRNSFRNPKYRIMYYRNQGYDGDLSVENQEEVQEYDNDENDGTEDRILGQKGLSENIQSYIAGNPKSVPVIYSMERQMRRLVKLHYQSEVTNKSILSVLENTQSFLKTQAKSFYSLISNLQTRYRNSILNRISPL
ncbi:uncharacterized protein LOC110178378 [Drosophila serrata]|uniref:uncharacterized protein LOC110178378 n=1 Tax=Drosophila serrata TaxID=7274 RepID=UPI000A1D360E|nr:uncharacterized protein LOC110178378 [Drosophila serrata]